MGRSHLPPLARGEVVDEEALGGQPLHQTPQDVLVRLVAYGGGGGGNGREGGRCDEMAARCIVARLITPHSGSSREIGARSGRDLSEIVTRCVGSFRMTTIMSASVASPLPRRYEPHAVTW